MDSDQLKERNYKLVMLVRQLNEREQKRLDYNRAGIKARCRYHLDQVSDEQRRIKRELVKVRTSSTNTWGFLPPRHDSKNTQPPTGLDQWAMEEFAKQFYNVKKSMKQSSPTRNGGGKTRDNYTDEDYDSDAESATAGLSRENSMKRIEGDVKKSPSKKFRNTLHADMQQAQENAMKRLSKPHSLHNTPVSSPHGRAKSLTDRGPRDSKSQGRSPNRRDRSVNLPPIPRKGQNGNSKMAWENTNKPGKPVTVYQNTGATDESSTSNSEQLSARTPKQPNDKPQTQATKPLKPKQDAEPNKSQPTDKKQAAAAVPKIAVQPPPPQNKPTDSQPKQPRPLTPIKENPAKEKPEKRQLSNVTKQPQPTKPKAKQRKESANKKSEANDPTKIDLEKYNPDGSLRTVHTLPDFSESLEEALKARYLRSRYKQWYEREMSVSECWSDQNLPWKKLTT